MELNSAYDIDDATHVSAASAADCYGKCHRNASCKTFTWHAQQGNEGGCYLQSNISKTQHQAIGSMSGHRSGTLDKRGMRKRGSLPILQGGSIRLENFSFIDISHFFYSRKKHHQESTHSISSWASDWSWRNSYFKSDEQ